MSCTSCTVALAFVAATAAALPGAIPLPAAAATEKVLYAFDKKAWGEPTGRLLFLKGKLIGPGTGDNNETKDKSPGQIFQLKLSNGSWQKKTIFKFDGTDGASPLGVTKGPNGALYGATFSGGTSRCYGGGCGTLFELTPNGSGGWTQSTIWDFSPNNGDSLFPNGDLIVDSSGAIYGTAYNGGTSGWGTVFKFTQSGGTWSEQILYNFTGGSDGAAPGAGLIMDNHGNLYGTTIYGGTGWGNVFELSRSGGAWTETVLYSFFSNGGSDGQFPVAPLIRDSSGNLYGTTQFGGANDNDYGTVFELSQSGGTWTETLLHVFDAKDGYEPLAGLHKDNAGNLYGTTYGGGAIGGGNLFQLTPSKGAWSFNVLHSFGGSGDGAHPEGAVILDQEGNLYGTTAEGGDTSCGKQGYGCGTVYEITP